MFLHLLLMMLLTLQWKKAWLSWLEFQLPMLPLLSVRQGVAVVADAWICVV